MYKPFMAVHRGLGASLTDVDEFMETKAHMSGWVMDCQKNTQH